MNAMIWMAVGMLLLVLAGITAIALRVSWKLTHPPRKPVDMDPQTFGIQATEAVTFPSRDPAVTLSGWYMSARANGAKSNGGTLIFAHGYSQNRQEPHLPALSLAARMLAEGYDVLMFDFRNAGESGGSLTTIGYWEQLDLLGAVDYIAQRFPQQAIGLIGFSMGAATSLLVAGQDARVQAVVADSPFFSLSEYLEENLPQWTGLPRFPFNWLILRLSPLLYGADSRDVKPFQAVTQTDKPILLIHGTGDDTVPCSNSERLHALAGENRSELWLVPDVGHVRSYAKYPDEYAEKVIAFFRRTLRASKNPLPLAKR
ncbi:alpha/beta hydrolase [Brevibacillus sp. H7]|uniref:alpha/beta hydrolase n=1 Tax=Brevibacillus sp. H7 TaxID=3349138 RepID=UPI003803B69A